MHRKLLAISGFLLATVIASGCQQATSSDESTTHSGPFDDAIEALAQQLTKYYLYPDVATKYAAMLRANLAKGTYQDFSSVTEIGKQVTADLQAVAPDQHLEVLSSGGHSLPPNVKPPPAIENASWVADGVALIRLNALEDDAASVATVESFMNDHVTAKAIIFDLRGNVGGGLNEVLVMLPYLYAQETVLLEMDTNENYFEDHGEITGSVMTPALRVVDGPPGIHRVEHVAIPNPTQKGLFGAQVFCLISSATVSAGEHLADALKCSGRATLIGETTGGAGHYALPTNLSDGLSVSLPVGETICPKTGLGWEGVGVEPDIAVAADSALDEALARVQ
jgi:hypothetical protein